MKMHLLALMAVLGLSACSTDPKPEVKAQTEAPTDGQWHASTLSPDTIAKANAAVKDYQSCLNRETLTHVNDPLDCRVIADGVLKVCESKLSGIKDAFEKEGVPDSISQRYMRKNRSQGAQEVLRYVMSVQAARVGEAQEKAAHNNNKP
ncbi:hypothetical protein [Methyloterricola oryzae]|uniref:hypothetical protein n=1 Tax=Methyloterricola oryzae TaxID=1495050 RepID=UPI0005EAD621|nr:hypothetical protein [Methyloterricola oryzae]